MQFCTQGNFSSLKSVCISQGKPWERQNWHFSAQERDWETLLFRTQLPRSPIVGICAKSECFHITSEYLDRLQRFFEISWVLDLENTLLSAL